MSSQDLVDSQLEWHPPKYDLHQPPRLVCSPNLRELEEDASFGDFFRSAKWAPDGNSVLATSEHRAFHLVNLDNESGYKLGRLHVVPQSAPILASTWYPSATSRNPASYCFVASIRDCPVRLIDASSGRLRASYRIIDHRERFIAPHSMAFNPDMSKLYCGCEDFIEIFDLHQPGDGERFHTTSTKKSKDGLKGIISALAFCADYSGLYAAATYSASSSIALFDQSSNHGAPITYLEGANSGGVSQLYFHPTQPHVLFAASRRSGYIQRWDLRNPSVPLDNGMFRGANKSGGTNQRMWFDIDLGGQWLASGNEAGVVSFFDASGQDAPESRGDEPTLTFQAHKDAIGSISFHPIFPLALTVSGSRQFDPPREAQSLQLDSNSGTLLEDDSSSGSGSDEDQVQPASLRGFPCPHDASMKLWDLTSPAPHQADDRSVCID